MMDDTERENTWAALRIIGETVETLGPPGVLPPREPVLTRDGPEPVHEGMVKWPEHLILPAHL
jgi:hypothetical protein